ncbi:MAG: hypothetical protein WCF84_03245 [Anaerolineae bacterium]
MLLNTKIQVSPKMVTVAVENKHLFFEMPALVLTCKADGKILALGEEATELVQRPTNLPKNLEAEYSYPLVSSQFDPPLAIAVISFSIYAIRSKLHQNLWRRILNLDHMNLNLNIWEYEKVESKKRRHFELLLGRQIPELRKISLNGRQINRPWLERRSVQLLIMCGLCILVTLILTR